MRDPLTVAKEFGLDHPGALHLLAGALADGEEYVSRADWRNYSAHAVTSTAADEPEIQQRLALLLESAD